jgi:murein DD-endopeptidase MepM/ murein hydrolase activator NlpD
MMYLPRPIYPHAIPPSHTRPTAAGLHVTAGLAGNVALDFMAAGGTVILAPQDCHVMRFSGHDPRIGVIGGDIYGWSTYLHVPDGYYFLTHQDKRYVSVGQWVKKGTPIGRVGSWPHNPPRSHSHLGFTHVKGEAASRARILKVASGPFRRDGSL